jgi:steroid 5-alpha reductase family enzyme
MPRSTSLAPSPDLRGRIHPSDISDLTLLLARSAGSGVTLLERGMVKRRPDYQAYVDTTSAFIPWFPRRRR